MAQVPVFPGEVRLVVVGAVAGIVLTVLQLVLSGLVYSWVVQPNHRLKRFSGRFWDQILVGIAAIFSGCYTVNCPHCHLKIKMLLITVHYLVQ